MNDNLILLTERARLSFERLGIYDPDETYVRNAALLRRIQYAMVTAVPYENLDILAGIPLPLDFDGLFDKIVTRRRGGYCFELNGFLAGLLRELGYKTTCYMARFLRGEDGIPMRRHRVVKAECDEGAFICDAAVGQRAPRYPLRFALDAEQEVLGEKYVIRYEPFYGYVIYDLSAEGEWRRFYSFTLEEQLDIDFVMPSYYCEHSQDSVFNKSEMVAIKTEDGRKTVDGRTFRIFSGDNVIEEHIHTDERMDEVLNTHFGIKINKGGDEQ